MTPKNQEQCTTEDIEVHDDERCVTLVYPGGDEPVG